MPANSNITSQRKKEHIEICLTDAPAFKEKKTGFDNYDFFHNAVTEVDITKINFETIFFTKKINYPFLISCMTGGTPEAGNINSRLAESANSLNIPLGVGSQRQALENEEYHKTYKIIREKAPHIPILGNIGASQIVKMKSFDQIQYLVDLVEADVLVIHLNPVQELIQKNGEPDFVGLLKSISSLVKQINVPVICKEVGAGISKNAAEKLINAGAQGIDVAGAGGTSWAGVEILRNKEENSALKISDQYEFWDWGLPTSFCIRTVSELKKNHDFLLIGSGGINNGVDAAKAYALGADIAASARIILQELNKYGVNGVNNLILSWFEIIKKIMFLTSSNTISELRKNKLFKKGRSLLTVEVSKFQSLYEREQKKVEKKLYSTLKDRKPFSLYKPSSYILESGGKRLRPILVLFSFRAVSGNYKRAYNAAAAVELLHNFTLVHDDIMDNADKRRGLLTLHKKYDLSTAILSGDSLLSVAYELLLKDCNGNTKSVISSFTQSLVEVCEGQSLDKEFETRKEVSIKEYLEMITKKTAAMAEMCCAIGAKLGGGNTAEIKSLSDFGKNIGIAFQIQDDLLDIFGDETEFGKVVGGDLVEGKKTFLFLAALKRAKGKDERQLQKVITQKGIKKEDIPVYRDLYYKLGAIDEAKKEIKTYSQKAINSLQVLKNPEDREIFTWLADSLLKRNK